MPKHLQEIWLGRSINHLEGNYAAKKGGLSSAHGPEHEAILKEIEADRLSKLDALGFTRRGA